VRVMKSMLREPITAIDGIDIVGDDS
jgi:hypothetical protein